MKRISSIFAALLIVGFLGASGFAQEFSNADGFDGAVLNNMQVNAAYDYAEQARFSVPSVSLDIALADLMSNTSFDIVVPVTNEHERDLTVSGEMVPNPINDWITVTAPSGVTIAGGTSMDLTFTVNVGVVPEWAHGASGSETVVINLSATADTYEPAYVGSNFTFGQ